MGVLICGEEAAPGQWALHTQCGRTE